MARFATIIIFVLSTAVLVVLQVITIHPRAKTTFGIIALIALGLCSVPLSLYSVENRVQLYYDGTNTCFYLYGQPQPDDSFRERLEKIGKASSTIRFSVQVCPEVPFRDVVRCVSLMQAAGVTNLVIDMRKWGGPSPRKYASDYCLYRTTDSLTKDRL